MKALLVGLLVLGSISSFADETCDVSNAKSALKEAKILNQDYKKCDSFECAKQASTAVQDKMCEATKACKEIAYDMYYPCLQRIALTHSDYNASLMLQKLIRRGLKKL